MLLKRKLQLTVLTNDTEFQIFSYYFKIQVYNIDGIQSKWVVEKSRFENYTRLMEYNLYLVHKKSTLWF